MLLILNEFLMLAFFCERILIYILMYISNADRKTGEGSMSDNFEIDKRKCLLWKKTTVIVCIKERFSYVM